MGKLFFNTTTLPLVFVLLFSCNIKPTILELKPMNILFIMSDDHAQQAISAYSEELIQTPNIDRIADEGILFTNSFVTNSICAPSRAVMLTGKYSHLNGLRDNRDRFNGDQNSWVKVLQKEGYQTSIIGKWHLKSEPQGFDDYNILIGQGSYYNPRMVHNGDTTDHTGYTTSIITNLALQTLKNRDPEKPFAMLMHHKAPHRNWMPEKKYFNLFKNKEIPIPESLFDNYEERQAASEQDMQIDNMFLSLDLKLTPDYYETETGTGGGPDGFDAEKSYLGSLDRLTPDQRKAWDAHYDSVAAEFSKADLEGVDLLKWKYKRYMQDYLSVTVSVDDGIGRVLDYLDENGLTENTLVIYTSDQGFYLGEHGWYDKRFMYEESLRTPLIVRIPGLEEKGKTIDKMVMNLDLATTILDFAGVQPPVGMQGLSWKQLVEAPDQPWRDAIYYHYYEYPHGWHSVKQHYGVRTERYKLIHFYNDIDTWELYDLKEDPGEMNNIYGDEGYWKITADLENKIEELRAQYEFKVVD